MTSRGWSGRVGYRRWSIFAGGGCGLGRRKGAVDPCLLPHGWVWARPLVFGTLWLSHQERGLARWNGDVTKSWTQDPTVPLLGDHLWDPLQEGKRAFVQLSGNIQSYDEATVFPPAAIKPILQIIFLLPSKLALLISLDHHMCNFAVAAACQLSVPENGFMSSKTRETWSPRGWCPNISAREAPLVPVGGWALTSQGPSLTSKKTFRKFTGT